MKRKAHTSDELLRSLENGVAKRPKLDDEDEDSGDDVVLAECVSDFSNENEDNERHFRVSRVREEPATSLSRLKDVNSKKLRPQKSTAQESMESYRDFSSMGISENLVASMNSMSIRRPTSVQMACIPPLLEGKDCIGNAKTGSGKTIAFALPILQKLLQDPYGIFALVLTPTRELAFQIADQFNVLGTSINLHSAIIVGGMDMMAQAIELAKRPHVVIATPGRLVDLMKSNNKEWDLSRVKFLILDEADRLLTETFQEDLAYLFNVIPKQRQTGLFTATLTPAIESLAEAPPKPGKQKPFIYRLESSVETVETLNQSYLLVPSHVREPYLYYFLCHPPESVVHLRKAPPEPPKRNKSNHQSKKQKKAEGNIDMAEQPPPTIIFCRRAYTAAYLTHLLQELSIRATALHSRLTQRERLNSLALFRSYVVPVLVCTDIAARGLDIEDVAMVINWDMPDEPEQYTHRVGRTARKGKGGVAVSFVTERDEERVIGIETRINIKLTEMTLSESKVLEKLNAVSTAKRLANMELHDSNFGEREKIHELKQKRWQKQDKR